ncbi:MAG: c-type cytochrome [Pirellulales bacterium]
MRKLSKARSSAVARVVALGLSLLAAFGCALCAESASAREAEWIWSPAYEKEAAPAGTCYFRKSFPLGAPEHGLIQIACDDSYELYVNGRHVGGGKNWKVLDEYDITKYLEIGQNTVAVKAENSEGNSAGLVARVAVKEKGNTHVEHSTNDTWKTALKEFPQWQKSRFADAQWLAARSFGAMGATLPWGNEVTVAGAEGRFRVTPEFHVEWVVDPKDTGSLICMAFDEFGQLIASRENGPLVVIRDDDKDGLVDSVASYCDTMKNCQGLLPISGKVFAVGEGPQGPGLYCLADEDHDGRIDRTDVVLKFPGEIREHGPHALALGPDGLLYMIVGNFSQIAEQFADSSPYHDFYEGDLVTPRYEDASGHAVGIKAPGGAIIRTDTAGTAVELFAGGMQNPYDLAFNAQGDLFTCDSDMEWDMGMSWYRPTRLLHVSAGAEFGWRSGWSKWPNYFVDSLPPTLELGRGSPAGIEAYNHVMFPRRYHDALFVCDWSRGRILCIRPKQHGATYRAAAEVFVEGQPLNVTDIAVGPDGWLYFCTGGRDTEGGVYRVVWDGKVPPAVTNRGNGINAAINQPQLQSAWGRQQVALVKQQLGEKWDTDLNGVAKDAKAPPHVRVRALELMQLYGPQPNAELLVTLSRDRATAVRAKCARLMGINAEDASHERLVELLGDADLAVQRAACEAVQRGAVVVPPEKLLPLLSSPDRYVSWAAGRALQQLPHEEWSDDVLKEKRARAFVNGATALLGDGEVDRPTIDGLLKQSGALMEGYLTDPEFIDLLRVMQLALIEGEITGDDIPELRTQVAEEYPSRDHLINRELVRVLVYLQDPTFAERLVEQLRGDLPSVEKMHLVMHARFLQTGWTLPLKLQVLLAYEEARAIEGGHSFAGYVENAAREFFATFDERECQQVLAEGVKWPSSALSVLAKLPEKPSDETLEQICNLDRQVKKLDTEAAKKLRVGICAVLGASGTPASMAYLRELYDEEPDRRVTIAIGLAQRPEDENWDYLVRSLSIVEGAAAQEVLMKLATVDQTSDDPEVFRQVILRGLMLRQNGSRRAVALLEKWTGETMGPSDEPWDQALTHWQQWFVEKYPSLPEPKLPVESEQSQWTHQELLSFLSGPRVHEAVASRGAALFEKAQCVKCHRFGDRGDTVGPDLTNISKRFQKKEILESILFPSQVISDQYASQTIVTKDGKTYTGMVAPTGDDSLTVLQISGEKVVVPRSDVEQTTRTKVSAMPDGLLNTLSLEEIADLFRYLSSPPAQDLAGKPADKRQR